MARGSRQLADNSPPGIRAPVWGKQAREGWHKVHAARVLHRLGQLLNVRRALYDAQVVPQPTHGSPGNGNGTLQCIDGWRFLTQLVGDCGEEAVVTLYYLRGETTRE